MSTYTCVAGSLSFSTTAAFDRAVTCLIDGGWLEPTNGYLSWVDETGDFWDADFKAVNHEDLSIEFIQVTQRNIDRAMSVILEKASAGLVKQTSSDGQHYVSVWCDGESITLTDMELCLAIDMDDGDADLLKGMDVDEWEDKWDGDYMTQLDEILSEAADCVARKIREFMTERSPK